MIRRNDLSMFEVLKCQNYANKWGNVLKYKVNE